jgi:predicted transcriptional regulator
MYYMPTSVRLDPRSEHLLELLARHRRSSKSDVLRDAIAELATRELESPSGDDSVLSGMSDLVGIARGGRTDLGRSHKRAFAEALREKRRR